MDRARAKGGVFSGMRLAFTISEEISEAMCFQMKEQSPILTFVWVEWQAQ